VVYAHKPPNTCVYYQLCRFVFVLLRCCSSRMDSFLLLHTCFQEQQVVATARWLTSMMTTRLGRPWIVDERLLLAKVAAIECSSNEWLKKRIINITEEDKKEEDNIS
jgi:hypothetical protein